MIMYAFQLEEKIEYLEGTSSLVSKTKMDDTSCVCESFEM